jgi:hypothetical protein
MPGTRTARSPARAAGTMPTRSRPPSPAAGVLPYCQRRPGRRSCAQGRWPVARAPATGWTDHDRGPQADAEERITSAHRAIEIREKRRRVLSSRPAGITLALQPTSSVSAAATHPIGQRTRRTPRSARHRWSRARRITTYRTNWADISWLCRVGRTQNVTLKCARPVALWGRNFATYSPGQFGPRQSPTPAHDADVQKLQAGRSASGAAERSLKRGAYHFRIHSDLGI